MIVCLVDIVLCSRLAFTPRFQPLIYYVFVSMLCGFIVNPVLDRIWKIVHPDIVIWVIMGVLIALAIPNLFHKFDKNR